jgi:hypothetical protein
MIDIIPAVLAADNETIDIVGKMVKYRRAEVGIHGGVFRWMGRALGLKPPPTFQFFTGGCDGATCAFGAFGAFCGVYHLP